MTAMGKWILTIRNALRPNSKNVSEGLNTPIVGDDIYGTSADRLMLHAETIEFEHPTTGEVILLSSKAEF